MLSVKTLIRALATSLCLLLVAASPGVAGEASFESLPIGAKARLGQGHITDAQYSPDGTRLAIGSSVGIWLYDTQTYETSLLIGHAYGVVGVAFSPDGRTLAVAGQDDTIRLWNPDTGTLRHILEDPSHSISGSDTSLAFSPDGRILASAPRTNTVHLWDTAEGTLRRTLKDSGAITSLAFSPDGRILAIGGWASSRMARGAVRLWDVTSTVQSWAVNTDILLYTLKSHTKKINSVAFSPDGQTLAAGGWFQRRAGSTQPQAFPDGQTLQLWDPDTGALRRTLEVHPGGIDSVAFSPDGQTLASASRDTLELWDAAEGTLQGTLEGHSGGILSVAFSPDGRTLASASWNNTVHFWDTAAHTLSHTLEGHTAPVRSLAFSPDSRLLASGDADNIVRLWDTATHTLRHTLTGHKFKIDSLAFSPDGRTLAAGSKYTLKLWDAEAGILRHKLETGEVTSLAFSPDGRTLASGGEDHTVRLWDADTGTLRHTLAGHADSVTFVAFSPDGRILASASADDHTIRLWDVATGSLQYTLEGHTKVSSYLVDNITSLLFSPDGRTLASASWD